MSQRFSVSECEKVNLPRASRRAEHVSRREDPLVAAGIHLCRVRHRRRVAHALGDPCGEEAHDAVGKVSVLLGGFPGFGVGGGACGFIDGRLDSGLGAGLPCERAAQGRAGGGERRPRGREDEGPPAQRGCGGTLVHHDAFASCVLAVQRGRRLARDVLRPRSTPRGRRGNPPARLHGTRRARPREAHNRVDAAGCASRRRRFRPPARSRQKSAPSSPSHRKRSTTVRDNTASC